MDTKRCINTYVGLQCIYKVYMYIHTSKRSHCHTRTSIAKITRGFIMGQPPQTRRARLTITVYSAIKLMVQCLTKTQVNIHCRTGGKLLLPRSPACLRDLSSRALVINNANWAINQLQRPRSLLLDAASYRSNCCRVYKRE